MTNEQLESIVLRLLKRLYIPWYGNAWLTWNRQPETRSEFIRLAELAKKDPAAFEQAIKERKTK